MKFNFKKLSSMLNVKKRFVVKHQKVVIDSFFSSSSAIAVKLLATANVATQLAAEEVVTNGDTDKIIKGVELIMDGLSTVDWSAVKAKLSESDVGTAEFITNDPIIEGHKKNLIASLTELITAYKGEK